MKTANDVVRLVTARLKVTWTTSVLAEISGQAPADDRRGWPYSVPLGKTASAEIARNFGEHQRSLHAWRDWSAANGVELTEVLRHIDGHPQMAATHVVVPDVDIGAAVAGDGWQDRLDRGRFRAAALLQRFPDTTPTDSRDTHALLRSAAQMSDLDFDILLAVADWFRQTPACERVGLTPRQVPLEGVHAKWLNTHQALVRTLAGLDDLELAPAHPARIHFTYLDPAHLTGGGRQHDSFSVGDAVPLPYEPRVVLITENKDTAVGFPRFPGGIAVEGNGAGGGAIADTPWIRTAPTIVYWGDMDIDGLEILDQYRRSGVRAASMLMTMDAYKTYRHYGTNHDRNGNPLVIDPRGEVSLLEEPERELYDLLISGEAPVLRVEQERIPLPVAAETLERLTGDNATQLDSSGRSDPEHLRTDA